MTTDDRHRVTREQMLRLTVPVLGLVLAAAMLLTSGHLTGAAGWYARVLVGLLGVVALVGTIVEVVRLATGPAEPIAEAELTDPDVPAEVVGVGGLIGAGIIAASIVAMLLLANILGFWLSMAIPVVAALLVLGVRTWWKVALAAVLTVAGGYVVFTILLQVRVPEGILGLL